MKSCFTNDFVMLGSGTCLQVLFIYFFLKHLCRTLGSILPCTHPSTVPDLGSLSRNSQTSFSPDASSSSCAWPVRCQVEHQRIWVCKSDFILSGMHPLANLPTVNLPSPSVQFWFSALVTPNQHAPHRRGPVH